MISARVLSGFWENGVLLILLFGFFLGFSLLLGIWDILNMVLVRVCGDLSLDEVLRTFCCSWTCLFVYLSTCLLITKYCS